MALRARKVSGAFEKRAPGYDYQWLSLFLHLVFDWFNSMTYQHATNKSFVHNFLIPMVNRRGAGMAQ